MCFFFFEGGGREAKNVNTSKTSLIIFSVLVPKPKFVSLKKTINLKKDLKKDNEENENDDFAGF